MSPSRRIRVSSRFISRRRARRSCRSSLITNTSSKKRATTGSNPAASRYASRNPCPVSTARSMTACRSSIAASSVRSAGSCSRLATVRVRRPGAGLLRRVLARDVPHPLERGRQLPELRGPRHLTERAQVLLQIGRRDAERHLRPADDRPHVPPVGPRASRTPTAGARSGTRPGHGSPAAASRPTPSGPNAAAACSINSPSDVRTGAPVNC